MPNNTKISDLDLASQLNEADLLLLSQQESESETENFDSKKTTVENLAEKVATGIQFSGLQTEDKTIQGAINEAAAVGKISDYYHIESFSGYHWENSGSVVDGHTVYQSRGTYEEISGNDLGTWTIGGYEDITFFIKQDGADTSKAYTVLGKPNTEIDLADSSSYQVSYQNQVLSNYTSYKFENLNGETNTFQILYHTDPNDPVGTAAVDLTDSQFVDTGTTIDGHTVYMSNTASKCKIKIQGTSSFKVCYKTNTSDSYNRIYIGQLDTPVSSSEYETRDWGQSDYYYDCDFTCSKNEEHYVEVMFSKPTYSESDCVYFYVVLNGDPHTTRGYVYVVPGQLTPSTYRGEVFNDYENNFALGQYSHAEGNATQATGNVSHAEGYKTKAQQFTAHAEGYNTIANQSAHAEGEDTQALGPRSHTEGIYTRTVQENSHAEGDSSLAYGYASHAEGTSEARGGRSHAEGYDTKAYGSHAHAEGTRTLAGSEDRADGASEAAHAEGIETQALNWAAHAEGRETIASGTYAHAEGQYTQATNSPSHAEGYNTMASGWGSHTEGQYTTASGQGAHAEGKYTDATGEGSHAEGLGTDNTHNISSGYGSHAEGGITNATGNFSHAEGYSNTASGQGSHAEGFGSYSGANIASGISSHAEGGGNTSQGNCTHTEGTRNVAFAEASHAEGSGNLNMSIEGHAEGAGNVVGGEQSHIEGAGNYATANHVHVEGSGNNSKPSASHSHIEGAGNNIYCEAGHVEGAGNTGSGNMVHVEGAGNQIHGHKSHGEGGGNYLSGYGSHAEGKHNVVIGTANHAEGRNNTVGIGDTSFGTFSYGTTYEENDIVCANVLYSPKDDYDRPSIFRCITAPGQIHEDNGIEIINPVTWDSETSYSANSVVKAEFSNGVGKKIVSYFYCFSAIEAGKNPFKGNGWTPIKKYLSPLIGEPAHSSTEFYLLSVDAGDNYSSYPVAKISPNTAVSAMWEAIPTASYSHVEGFLNIASGDYQHVQGKYNAPDTQKAFIIGNGSETEGVITRSNAMTVDWNGNMVLAGDITPGATLNTQAQTVCGAINEIVAKIPAPPTVDGTYTLSVTVSNGVPTYSWV